MSSGENDPPRRLILSDRPTDKAKYWFMSARLKAQEAHFALGRLPAGRNEFPDEQRVQWLMTSAVAGIALGLEELSSGLRATYMLLEQVNRKLPK